MNESDMIDRLVDLKSLYDIYKDIYNDVCSSLFRSELIKQLMINLNSKILNLEESIYLCEFDDSDIIRTERTEL